jgi:hypothetical protein
MTNFQMSSNGAEQNGAGSHFGKSTREQLRIFYLVAASRLTI